jgi:hypothetical protein
MNMGNNTAKKPEKEELDLFEYAAKMGEHIKELKEGINTLSDEELSLMIEQNKVCKKMYERVFAVLVTEQIKRMNQSKEIFEGIEDSDISKEINEEISKANLKGVPEKNIEVVTLENGLTTVIEKND